MVERQDPTTSFAIATETEAIGGIGVSISKDVHRFTAELGYWLGRQKCWGKGSHDRGCRTVHCEYLRFASI